MTMTQTRSRLTEGVAEQRERLARRYIELIAMDETDLTDQQRDELLATAKELDIVIPLVERAATRDQTAKLAFHRKLAKASQTLPPLADLQEALDKAAGPSSELLARHAREQQELRQRQQRELEAATDDRAGVARQLEQRLASDSLIKSLITGEAFEPVYTGAKLAEQQRRKQQQPRPAPEAPPRVSSPRIEKTLREKYTPKPRGRATVAPQAQ